MAEVMIQVW